MDLSAHPIFAVLAIAVVAALAAEIPIGVRVPPGVLMLLLGVVVGPHVLDVLRPEAPLIAMGFYGTCALFFMAGMELDLERVRGRPLALAFRGWLLSVAVGLLAAAILNQLPMTRSPLFLAIALSTSALGFLVPILRDANELDTAFGRSVLAAGAAGEFGPVMAMSLVFARDFTTLQEAGLMLVFVGLAAFSAFVALTVRPPRLVTFLTAAMHRSAQLPVLLAGLFLSGLVVLVEGFGLEKVLGAFAAGMVVGIATRREEGRTMRIKIEAIMYGFLVPFFYVVSGMQYDLAALTSSSRAMLMLPLFLALLFAVRGVSVLVYGATLARGEKLPFALYSATALPILIALAEIGVGTGRMLPDVAAALVGAGVVSVLAFPALALRLRSRQLTPSGGTLHAA